jgi:hypothetical protein
MYLLQYQKEGDNDWVNGTTVTPSGEDVQILIEQDLEPEIAYMFRVIPVTTTSSKGLQVYHTYHNLPLSF